VETYFCLELRWLKMPGGAGSFLGDKGYGGTRYRGGLAQLGEHLLCKQGVVGSIPSSSTKILLTAFIQVQVT
jgi:hypothetical protein